MTLANLNLPGKPEAVIGVVSSDLLGGTRLMWLWFFFLVVSWCFIRREIHFAVLFCLIRSKRRLMCFLGRLHRLLIIRWLKGRILALKILHALLQVRNRFVNMFVAHKYPIRSIIWCPPNDPA